MLRRVTEVEGVPFEVLDGEERVRDLALGEVLGYERSRVIRELIERNLSDLPEIHVRRTVRRTSMPNGGERETEGSENLLTLDEALFVAARSETPAGAAVLRRLIRVFRLAREGRLGEAAAVPSKRSSRHNLPAPSSPSRRAGPEQDEPIPYRLSAVGPMVESLEAARLARVADGPVSLLPPEEP